MTSDLKSVQRLVGFDLGHGETSVARMNVTNGSQPYVVEVFPGSRVVTTAVAKLPSGTIVIGDNAALLPDATDMQAKFKSPHIADPRVHRPTSAFVGAVLDLLVDSGEAIDGDTLVVFGHPSGWTETEVADYEQLLRQSVGPARTMMMPESRAAFLTIVHERDSGMSETSIGERVLIIDIGSSTTDFTVARGSVTTDALGDAGNFDGVALGAGLIEDILLERATRGWKYRRVRRWLERHRSERVRALLEFRREKEKFFSREHLFRQTGQTLIASVELMTSRRTLLTARLSAEDFDAAMNAPLATLGGMSWLARYRHDLQTIADSIGGPPGLVIVTGGGSRMACTVEIAKETFPAPTRVHRAGQPEHAISLGLARAGTIRRRAEGFRAEVRAMVEARTIAELVESRLPEYADVYARWHTDEVFGIVAPRALARWRQGEIETLNKAATVVVQELLDHLASQPAQDRLADQARPWNESLGRQVEQLVAQACARHDIPFELIDQWRVEPGAPPNTCVDVNEIAFESSRNALLRTGFVGGAVVGGGAGSLIPIPVLGTALGAVVGAVTGTSIGALTALTFDVANVPLRMRNSQTDERLLKRLESKRGEQRERTRRMAVAALVGDAPDAVTNREQFIGIMVNQIEQSLLRAAENVEMIIR
ncbi:MULTISPECIES: Hsp70 family protein [unclassified Micromonospora]|uniref:Hsp70 family protein n=1 Tax=unclassified Micromonospora TaxID=2617518 RepID=UPI003629E0DF